MLPELARLATRSAYRFFDTIVTEAGTEQRILANTLPGHLYGLVLKRRTGLLVARDGKQQIRLYLRDGAVVFSSSTDPRHLLGSVVVEQGICPRQHVEQALVYGWPRGMRLGEALVALGVVTQDELQALLGEQLLARCKSLCTWRSGELAFSADAEPGDVASVPRLPPLALVTRAVLDAYQLPEIQRLLTPLWHAPLRRGREADAVRAALGVDVQYAEALVLAMRGSTLARQVNDADGDGQLVAARVKAIFLGIVTGVLRAG
jgi:hypothetical protein